MSAILRWIALLGFCGVLGIVLMGSVAATDDLAPQSSHVELDSCGVINESGQYALNQSIDAFDTCIEVTADDVVFDGNGHSLNGSALGYAVEVSGDNVTVQNLTTDDSWFWGIRYSSANDGTIRNVSVMYGVRVMTSPNMDIVDVRVAGGTTNDGIQLHTSPNATVRDSEILEAEAGVHLIDSPDSRISNTTIDDNGGVGIGVDSSNRTSIENGTILNNADGISVTDSHNTSIASTVMEWNVLTGISLSGASNTTVTDSAIAISDGLVLESSSSATVSNLSVNQAIRALATTDDSTISAEAVTMIEFTPASNRVTKTVDVDLQGADITLNASPQSPLSGYTAVTPHIEVTDAVQSFGSSGSVQFSHDYNLTPAVYEPSLDLWRLEHDGWHRVQGTTVDSSSQEISANLTPPDNDQTTYGLYATELIDACRVLDTPGEYALAGNLTTSGTCLEITADNVSVDGMGHTINVSNPVDNTEAILLNRTNDTTVRNLTIDSDYQEYGIRAIDANRPTIDAVSMNTVWRGIWFDTVTDGTVNSTVLTGHLDGLYVEQSVNTTITNLTAHTFSGDDLAAGIQVDDSVDTTVANSALLDSRAGLHAISSQNTTLVNTTAIGPLQTDVYTEGGSTTSGQAVTVGSYEPNTTVDFDTLDGLLEGVGSPPNTSGYGDVGRFVEVNATEVGGYVDLGLAYTESDLDGVIEGTLGLWRYDAGWQEVPGSSVDTGQNRITANLTSFSTVTGLGSTPGVESCRELSVAGEYELDSDLASNETCLEISASDVALDGNGHSIIGDDPELDASGIAVGDVQNVTVHNVTVEQWDYDPGILVDGGAATIDLLDVTLEDNDVGVYVEQSDSITVHDSVVRESGTVGIDLRSGSGSATISANNISHNGAEGIQVQGSETTITDNTFLENGPGNTITDDAISLLEGINHVQNNTIMDSGRDGILVWSSGNTIDNNTISNSGSDGMRFGPGIDNNSLEDNVIVDSGFAGIELTGSWDNEFRSNEIVGADAYGVQLEAGSGDQASANTFSDTSISAVDGAGVQVSDSPDVSLTNTTVTDSGDAGINLENATNTTISGASVPSSDPVIHAMGGSNVTATTVDIGDSLAANTTVDLQGENVSIGATTAPVPSHPDLQSIGRFVNVTTTGSNASLDLELDYELADVETFFEDSLELWQHTGNWTTVDDSTLDTGARTVSGSVSENATLGLFGTSTAVSGCTEIDTPGSYELVANLTSNETCLEISADGVSLDGNGHEVIGQDPVTDARGIIITGSNGSVTNVTVADWWNEGAGIRTSFVSNVTLSDVSVRNSTDGVVLYSQTGAEVPVTLTNATVRGSDDGIGVYGSESVVVNTSIRNTWNNGMYIAAAAVEVTGNVIEESGNAGVYLTGSANESVIASNTLERNGYGVAVAGGFGSTPGATNTTVSENDIIDTEFTGIGVTANGDANSTVVNNRIENATEGIEVTDSQGNQFRNNSINGSYQGAGVFQGYDGTSEDNHFADLTITNSTDVGLVASAGTNTLYENITVSEVAGDAISVGTTVPGPNAENVTIRNATLRAYDDAAVRVIDGNTTLEAVDIGNASAPGTTIDGTLRDVAIRPVQSPPSSHPDRRSLDRFVEIQSIENVPTASISLHYGQEDLGAVTEDSLGLWTADGGWAPVNDSAVDTTTNRVSGDVETFDAVTGIFGSVPPSYAVTIQNTSSPVAAGDTLSVTVELENQGTVNGSQTIAIANESGDVDTETVALDGGETETVTLEWHTDIDDLGTQNMTVSSANDTATETVTVFEETESVNVTIEGTNAPISAGGSLVVNVSAENTGNVETTQTLELRNDTGVQLDAVSMTLQPNETTVENLRWNPADSVGNHTLTVSSENDSDSVDVEILDLDSYTVTIDETTAPVVVGENLSVTVTVANPNAQSDIQHVDLLDFNGTTVATATLGLQGGDSMTKTLNWSTEPGDIGTDQVIVQARNDSDSATVTILDDKPIFDVAITDINEPVTAGETLTVNASIENVGTVADTQTVHLFELTGAEAASGEISLQPNESTTETFSWDTTPSDVGTGTMSVFSDNESSIWYDVTVEEAPAPPNFSVTITDTNDPVQQGENLTVTTNVTNDGDEQGTQSIELRNLSDGLVDSETVSLAAGETTTTPLVWETQQGDAGDGNVTVQSENSTDSAPVSITAPAPPPPPPPSGGGSSSSEPAAPASFAVVNATVSETTVAPGTAISAAASVVNQGELRGTHTVSLTVNGADIETKDVTVAGGRNETVTFEWAPEEAGTYDVAVGDDTAGTVDVESAIESITLEVPESIAVDERVTLAAHIVRADGSETDVTDEATFTVADEDVATIEDGELVAESSGETEIEVTYEGETAAATVTVPAEDDGMPLALIVLGVILVVGLGALGAGYLLELGPFEPDDAETPSTDEAAGADPEDVGSSAPFDADGADQGPAEQE